jgi:CheY-like chemotaxis protein
VELDAVEILLVEDSDEDAELTLRAFRKLRLANRVVRVADGEEALRFLNGANGRSLPASLKLVLLDLKLPKMDGLAVLRALRQSAHTRTLPVVVMTSSREDRDLEEAYDLGVNSYIVKPVDFEQFSESAERLGLYWLVLNQRPRS